ncbi:MAG: MMPL family transporter [Pseudomonadota bacterium]
MTTPPDHSADNTPASPPGSAFGGVAESQAHDRGYSALIGPVLQGLCGVATRFALPVIMAFVAVAVAAGWFTANQLTLDTDTTAMFDKREPFRQHYEAYVRVFPDPRGAIIAIVDANHPALAREKAQRLAGLLEDQPTRFLDVQYTAGLPFFEEHGLLFLSLAELDALSQALAEAQPLLARLVLDPNLTGLADLYRTSLEAVLDEQVGEDALARLDPLLTLLAETLERYQAGEPVYANWEALFSMTPGNTPGDTDAPATTQDPAIAGFYREIVTIYPILDTTSLRPAEQAINAIEAAKNQLADEQTSPADAVTTFLTGEPVLAQEEMETVVIGAGLAGILSLVLVTLILGVGLASISLIAAILITLITGLVITAGLATLVVGSLNLISVAFAVLFVGLAVDFAIHFGLRYRENLSVTDTKQRALRHAAGQYGVGPALLICSACTLICFVS